jgi:hypothetical protein
MNFDPAKNRLRMAGALQCRCDEIAGPELVLREASKYLLLKGSDGSKSRLCSGVRDGFRLLCKVHACCPGLAQRRYSRALETGERFDCVKLAYRHCKCSADCGIEVIWIDRPQKSSCQARDQLLDGEQLEPLFRIQSRSGSKASQSMTIMDNKCLAHEGAVVNQPLNITNLVFP